MLDLFPSRATTNSQCALKSANIFCLVASMFLSPFIFEFGCFSLVGWRKMINPELPSNFLRRGHSCAAGNQKINIGSEKRLYVKYLWVRNMKIRHSSFSCRSLHYVFLTSNFDYDHSHVSGICVSSTRSQR
jgi:hypothetical protein